MQENTTNQTFEAGTILKIFRDSVEWNHSGSYKVLKTFTQADLVGICKQLGRDSDDAAITSMITLGLIAEIGTTTIQIDTNAFEPVVVQVEVNYDAARARDEAEEEARRFAEDPDA